MRLVAAIDALGEPGSPTSGESVRQSRAGGRCSGVPGRRGGGFGGQPNAAKVRGDSPRYSAAKMMRMVPQGHLLPQAMQGAPLSPALVTCRASFGPSLSARVLRAPPACLSLVSRCLAASLIC